MTRCMTWKLRRIEGTWFPVWSTTDQGFLTNAEAHVICKLRNEGNDD